MADTLNASFAAVLDEGITIQKNAINPHFKNRYVTLDKVLDIVNPVLKKHGLYLIQLLSSVDNKPALYTGVLHLETGDQMGTTIPLELDRAGPQAVGSAITYYRRYAILTMLNLVADEDDDAEKAQESTNVVQTGENSASLKF